MEADSHERMMSSASCLLESCGARVNSCAADVCAPLRDKTWQQLLLLPLRLHRSYAPASSSSTRLLHALLPAANMSADLPRASWSSSVAPLASSTCAWTHHTTPLLANDKGPLALAHEHECYHHKPTTRSAGTCESFVPCAGCAWTQEYHCRPTTRSACTV